MDFDSRDNTKTYVLKNKIENHDVIVFNNNGNVPINDIGTSIQNGPVDIVNIGDGNVNVGSNNGNGNSIDNRLNQYV